MRKVTRAQKESLQQAISRAVVAKYGKTIPEWMEVFRKDKVHERQSGEAVHFVQNKYGLPHGYAVFLLAKFDEKTR
ncbi:MAG: DUF4287 domain-containing protein [Candidatus Aenigmarchaeota archaeon]|nr:DUF4287 domain-containing protein [Candidatus Aenigmarchaeota archaeon]